MRRKLTAVFLCALILVLCVPSLASVANAKSGVSPWLIMAYLDGDTGDYVEAMVLHDMIEMERAFYHGVICVVCIDLTNNWPDSADSNTRYYEITAGFSTLMMDKGELNMGDPTTLSDFIIWAETTFPATKRALVLSNHGAGWHGLCTDYTTHTGDFLQTVELTTALSAAKDATGVTLDMLGFDACKMGEVEMAYQVKTYAKVMVASQQNEFINPAGSGDPPYDAGYGGWPWTAIITGISNQLAADGAGLATIVCDEYYYFWENCPINSWYTMSGVRLQTTDMTNLANAINTFGNELVARWAKYGSKIAICRGAVQDFPIGAPSTPTEYVDLYDFVDRVDAENMGEKPAFRNAMSAIRSSIDNMIVTERHDAYDPGAHGLSLYFPEVVFYDGMLYDDLALTVAAPGWYAFLITYNGM